jgi:hypothetical protein
MVCSLLFAFFNLDRKGNEVMGRISFWFKWFLILLVLSAIAFAEGFYIGGPFGLGWLAATHMTIVGLAVLLMRKYGIVCRVPNSYADTRPYHSAECASANG